MPQGWLQHGMARLEGQRVERDELVLSVPACKHRCRGKPGAQIYFAMAAAHPRDYLGGGNRVLTLEVLAGLGVSRSLLGTCSESEFQAPKERQRCGAQVLRTTPWDLKLIFRGKKGLELEPEHLPARPNPRSISCCSVTPLWAALYRYLQEYPDSLFSLLREVLFPWPGN